jgi:YD repeat-containing protein
VRTITDGTSTVTLGFDADGHVVSRSCSDGTATAAKYTDTGLLSTTTDMTGAVTSYSYDAAGRMTTATQTRGTTVLASVTYTYDALSRVKTTTRVNGVTTTNTWTARNHLSSQRTTSGSGSLIEEHDYTYDSHGNVATRTDTDAAGTWTTACRYDAYNRLISSATYVGSTASGLAWTSTIYTVNVAGDVVGTTTTTRLPVGGQPPLSSRTTNTIDAAGQLTAQTTNGTTVKQAFDGDGRVTQSMNGSAMAYDTFDRMVTAIRGETTATYTYWPDGTRRSTTTASAAGGTSTSKAARASFRHVDLGGLSGGHGQHRRGGAPSRRRGLREHVADDDDADEHHRDHRKPAAQATGWRSRHSHGRVCRSSRCGRRSSWKASSCFSRLQACATPTSWRCRWAPAKPRRSHRSTSRALSRRSSTTRHRTSVTSTI